MGDRLKIGVIAPPWHAVSPTQTTEIELSIDILVRGLSRLGHEVTLFTVGDSLSPVRRRWKYRCGRQGHENPIAIELAHSSAAYNALAGCDIIHDHTIGGSVMALALGVQAPLVITVHSHFTAEINDILDISGVPVIALSLSHRRNATGEQSLIPVVVYGIDHARYPFSPSPGRGLAVVAKMHSQSGVEQAIRLARHVNQPLTILGTATTQDEIDYYDSVVQPRLGATITYVSNPNHSQKINYLKAASALLDLSGHSQPFNLSAIEALACGTPIISGPIGPTAELIDQGITGFIVSDPDHAHKAVAAASQVDRRTCRESTSEFSIERVARSHELVYRSTIKEHGSTTQPIRSRPPRRYPTQCG